MNVLAIAQRSQKIRSVLGMKRATQKRLTINVSTSATKNFVDTNGFTGEDAKAKKTKETKEKLQQKVNLLYGLMVYVRASEKNFLEAGAAN